MNFTETLDKAPDQIEKPPLLPVGTYVWQVEKIPNIDTAKNDWEIVDYQLRCLRPTEDVDSDAIQAFQAKAGKLTDQRQRVSFLFSKDDPGNFARTEFNHKQFLQNTLKCWADGETLKQAMAKSVNCQCLGSIKWVQDKNNMELQYANIGRTAPIE